MASGAVVVVKGEVKLNYPFDQMQRRHMRGVGVKLSNAPR